MINYNDVEAVRRFLMNVGGGNTGDENVKDRINEVCNLAQLAVYMRDQARGQEEFLQRVMAVASAYKSGKTLDEIGEMFSVTRERIRQLIVKARAIGLIDKEAVVGVGERKRQRLQKVRDLQAAKNERRARDYYGCDYETLIRLNDGKLPFSKTKPLPKSYYYFHQKRAMKMHGYEWNLTFPEWCAVWETDPTKWEHRGRGSNCYTVSRIDHAKGFEVGNVKLANARELGKIGGKRGWTLKRSSVRNEVAAKNLNEKMTQALHMREVEKKSCREIGEILGIKHTTAASYCTAERNRRENQGLPPSPAEEKEKPIFPLPKWLR